MVYFDQIDRFLLVQDTNFSELICAAGCQTSQKRLVANGSVASDDKPPIFKFIVRDVCVVIQPSSVQ